MGTASLTRLDVLQCRPERRAASGPATRSKIHIVIFAPVNHIVGTQCERLLDGSELWTQVVSADGDDNHRKQMVTSHVVLGKMPSFAEIPFFAIELRKPRDGPVSCQLTQSLTQLTLGNRLKTS